MAKANPKETRAQLRKSLSILKARGLYKPTRPHAKPTKYAAGLVKKFADVVAGKSFVVKADKAAIPGLSENYRTRRGRVIVPKDTFTDKVRFDKKSGGLVKYKKTRNANYKFVSANVKSLDDLPPLKKGQTYAVPFRQGRYIEFQTRASLEELKALLMEYETRKLTKSDGSTRVHKNWAQEDIIKHIQIGTVVGRRHDDEDDGEE